LDLAIVLTEIILLLIYCDDIPHDVEEVVENLIYVSLTILAGFIFELSLQMYAFGLKEWCKAPLHIFDFVIVVITFVLEIVFHNHSEQVEATVGLLVGFRLWRLVRVVHVTTEALDLKHESEVEFLRGKVKDLEAQLQSMGSLGVETATAKVDSDTGGNED